MTKKDKQLLLKDLCSRLPYGVRARFCDGVKEETDDVWDIDMFSSVINADYIIDDVKPYLRPMSSMTEEEEKEYIDLREDVAAKVKPWKCFMFINWLNEHHFDYNDLISKNLTIEAPEEMYKEQNGKVEH